MSITRTPGQWRKTLEELNKFDGVRVKVGFPKGKPVAGSSASTLFAKALSHDANGKRKLADKYLAAAATAEGNSSKRKAFSSMGEVASIALINDIHRPFLKAGIEAGRPQIKGAMFKSMTLVSDGTHDATAAAAVVGEVGAAMVKRYIRDGSHTPNSPETIAKKGSSKPLIDTAQMLNSVTYSVGVE